MLLRICVCFWVPPYDLFTSAHKAVFPTSMVTGVHWLENVAISAFSAGGQLWRNVPGVHPLRVEFKYTVRGPEIIMCNHNWWKGVWVRINLPQKSLTVLSEPLSLNSPPPPPSPNKKFLDLPLTSYKFSRLWLMLPTRLSGFKLPFKLTVCPDIYGIFHYEISHVALNNILVWKVDYNIMKWLY